MSQWSQRKLAATRIVEFGVPRWGRGRDALPRDPAWYVHEV